MAKTFIGVRVDPEIKQKLDEEAERTGLTLTELTERALSAYLDVDTGTPNLSDVVKRLERLESKIGGSNKLKESDKHKDISFNKPEVDTPPSPVKPEEIKDADPIDVDDLGELITKKEASALTGYALTTFSGKFTPNGIHEKGKRGKEGLYSKTEILEKMGYKRGYEPE